MAGRKKHTPCKQCKRPTLLPENVAALDLYNDCATQWNTSANGFLVGLNYQGVESVMRIQGIQKKEMPRIFLQLQVLERETINERNKKTTP